MAARKTKKPETAEPAKSRKQIVRALRPLLYDGLVIKTGEEITFRDDTVEAWIKEGSAGTE